MGLRVWGTLWKRAAISWVGLGQVHVGLGRICAVERELFPLWPRGVRWGRYHMLCSGRYAGGWCLHNSDKGHPGNCKFHSLTAVTLAPRDWEDFSCREKNTQLYALPGNEDGLTEWSSPGDWHWDVIAIGPPGLGQPWGGNYHFDYVQKGLFMHPRFLIESDWIFFLGLKHEILIQINKLR